MTKNKLGPMDSEPDEPIIYSKRRFTPSEDKIIISLAKPNCTNDWSIIAKSVEKRSARQCRDRWNNYLNPNLNKDEWVPEEDELLIKIFNEKGPQWKSFSLMFKGRSINNVRNRCFKLLRKNHRNRPVSQIYEQSKSHSSSTRDGRQNKNTGEKMKKKNNELINHIDSSDFENNIDQQSMNERINNQDEIPSQFDQKKVLDVDYFLFDNDNVAQKSEIMLPKHSSEANSDPFTGEECNLKRYSVDTSEVDKVMSRFEKSYYPIDIFSYPFFNDMDIMQPHTNVI